MTKGERHEFSYLNSKITEVRRLASGNEGTTYAVRFEDESGKPKMMVIKKFDQIAPERKKFFWGENAQERLQQ